MNVLSIRHLTYKNEQFLCCHIILIYLKSLVFFNVTVVLIFPSSIGVQNKIFHLQQILSLGLT
jgi:hypothetical protein